MPRTAAGAAELASAMREPIIAVLSSTFLHDARSNPGLNGENFYAQKLLNEIKTPSDLVITGVNPPYIVSIEPSSHTAKATRRIHSSGIVLGFDRYDPYTKRPCGETRRIVIGADEWMPLMQERLQLIENYNACYRLDGSEAALTMASNARKLQGTEMATFVQGKAAQEGIALSDKAAQLLAYTATELLSARMRSQGEGSTVAKRSFP